MGSNPTLSAKLNWCVQMHDRFIVLQGHACSVVLECVDGGAPLWRHWGSRLRDAIEPSVADSIHPSFSLDSPPAFSIFPTFGLGWFGQSALLAHREGRDFAQGWSGCLIERPAVHSVVITLSDSVAAIEAAIALSLDPQSDVLTIETRLHNVGQTVLDMQWLAAACLPLPPTGLVIRSFGGRHNNEFVASETRLDATPWRRENRRGLTSHEDFAGAVVLVDDGGAFGAQLAWSGNHVQSIDPIDDGRRQWQFGEWLAPGEVRLAPGETITTPQVLATFSPDGPGGVARNYHRAVRTRMTWPGGTMRPRPVHLNTWEAVYFKHNVDDLKQLAEAAAGLGVERFVLDDGWFGRRDDDTSSLGDWTVDLSKYPGGLAPLADHITGLGMEFGLWVEPEMISPDSDLFRAHPDWAMALDGRKQITGRNQLVLDMTRTVVADHIHRCIDNLLRDLPVAYLKWDHNRHLATAAGLDGTPRYREQVAATWALIDRIRSAHPRLEIESCAGGGGRIDAGIARRTHRFWASDNVDALSRIAIQSGFLQFMPPELMGAHVGASPSHATGRRQSLDFRVMVAMQGHFGVELDPRALDDAESARLGWWIARYKEWRDVLHSGGVWQGQLDDHRVWQARGSPSDLFVFLYRLAPPRLRYEAAVRLPMLDRDKRYIVERLDRPEALQQIDGDWLAAVGLSFAPLKAEQGAIYRFTAC